MKKIKQTMTIREVLESLGDKVDKGAEVLMSSGMGCVGCPCAQMETLEQGCMAHGLTEEEIKKLVDELNGLLVNYKN